MLCQVVLDDNTLFLRHVRTVGFHDQKFTLPELVFAGSVVNALYIVCVICDFELFLQSATHFDRPELVMLIPWLQHSRNDERRVAFDIGLNVLANTQHGHSCTLQ